MSARLSLARRLALAIAALGALAQSPAEARATRREAAAEASIVAPPLAPNLKGIALDPAWPKQVYVITDSVMLGAKQAFIRSLPDWQVTYAGRPALMIRKALDDVRRESRLGPVAVVALGYNSLWEKDRRDFKRWADRFDRDVEDMLASLKERGAKKIVWVMLRELTPDIVPASKGSVAQYHKYAWYFPYVNERLKAIKARHPEMALADWATAGRETGVTYDAIHLNPRGAELMSRVVQAGMGVGGAFQRASMSPVRTAEVGTTGTVAQGQSEMPAPPPAEAQPAAPAKKPNYRARRQGMFAMTRFETMPVVMLGDSLTERAQWAEISGCRYVANRGIGGDDSAGVLKRLDDVTRLKPTAVFLMVGINDILSDVPTEQIAGNVEQTVGRLTRAGARVYLELVLPVREGFRRGKVSGKVDELNEALGKLATQPGVSIVDLRAAMRGGGSGLREDLSIDGIHLSPAGYRVWRDAVAPLVAKHCAVPAAAVAAAPGRATTDPAAATASIPQVGSAPARSGR